MFKRRYVLRYLHQHRGLLREKVTSTAFVRFWPNNMVLDHMVLNHMVHDHIIGSKSHKSTSTCFCSKMAYTLSLVAKLGATVIFNRISRVDVNISLEELFRSNIEDRGNDVKLVKVKVGEERSGPWSNIDGSETVQSCKDMQLRCILFVWQGALDYFISTQYIHVWQTTYTYDRQQILLQMCV